MPLYLVLRAHRGRYGYVRAGEHVQLPENYAKDLQRFTRPLVREMTAEEIEKANPGAASSEAPPTEGETQAGAATEQPPAGGSARPLSSQQVGRRSRRKTSSPAGGAPG